MRYTQRFVRIDGADNDGASGGIESGASSGIDGSASAGCCSGGREPIVINTLIVVADAGVSGSDGTAASPSIIGSADASAAFSSAIANVHHTGSNTDDGSIGACDDDAYPPLVLVHGFAGSVGLWCKNLTALAAVRVWGQNSEFSFVISPDMGDSLQCFVFSGYDGCYCSVHYVVCHNAFHAHARVVSIPTHGHTHTYPMHVHTHTYTHPSAFIIRTPTHATAEPKSWDNRKPFTLVG